MKISVITINYNDLDGLKKTVQSVAAQDYDYLEYIVIDGGSADGSAQFLEERGEHFHYWISEKDTGIYNAMNKGIRKATGDFLLFLNSGDILENDMVISKMSKYFTDEFDIYYGNLIIDKEPERKLIEFPKELDFSFFFHRGYLPHPSTFIRSRLFEELFMYSEDLKIASDWEFMVCAVCKFNKPYRYVDLAVSVYDSHGISSNPEHRQLLLDEKDHILRKHFSAHLKDAQRLLKYQEQMSKKEYQLLQSLNRSGFGRRITRLTLKFLAFIFGRND